jgi:hypothetical protein
MTGGGAELASTPAPGDVAGCVEVGFEVTGCRDAAECDAVI